MFNHKETPRGDRFVKARMFLCPVCHWWLGRSEKARNCQACDVGCHYGCTSSRDGLCYICAHCVRTD